MQWCIAVLLGLLIELSSIGPEGFDAFVAVLLIESDLADQESCGVDTVLDGQSWDGFTGESRLKHLFDGGSTCLEGFGGSVVW